jgi:hypothetical protein
VRRLTLQFVASVGLLALLAACASGESPVSSPMPSAGGLTTTIQSPVPLPVSVIDRTGLVTSIQPFDPQQLPRGDDSSDSFTYRLPDPHQVVFRWLGGACDALAQLTISDGGASISVNTVPQELPTTGPNGVPYACDAVGIVRAVLLVFSQPVATLPTP